MSRPQAGQHTLLGRRQARCGWTELIAQHPGFILAATLSAAAGLILLGAALPAVDYVTPDVLDPSLRRLVLRDPVAPPYPSGGSAEEGDETGKNESSTTTTSSSPSTTVRISLIYSMEALPLPLGVEDDNQSRALSPSPFANSSDFLVYQNTLEASVLQRESVASLGSGGVRGGSASLRTLQTRLFAPAPLGNAIPGWGLAETLNALTRERSGEPPTPTSTSPNRLWRYLAHLRHPADAGGGSSSADTSDSSDTTFDGPFSDIAYFVSSGGSPGGDQGAPTAIQTELELEGTPEAVDSALQPVVDHLVFVTTGTQLAQRRRHIVPYSVGDAGPSLEVLYGPSCWGYPGGSDQVEGAVYSALVLRDLTDDSYLVPFGLLGAGVVVWISAGSLFAGMLLGGQLLLGVFASRGVYFIATSGSQALPLLALMQPYLTIPLASTTVLSLHKMFYIRKKSDPRGSRAHPSRAASRGQKLWAACRAPFLCATTASAAGAVLFGAVRRGFLLGFAEKASGVYLAQLGVCLAAAMSVHPAALSMLSTMLNRRHRVLRINASPDAESPRGSRSPNTPSPAGSGGGPGAAARPGGRSSRGSSSSRAAVPRVPLPGYLRDQIAASAAKPPELPCVLEVRRAGHRVALRAAGRWVGGGERSGGGGRGGGGGGGGVVVRVPQEGAVASPASPASPRVEGEKGFERISPCGGPTHRPTQPSCRKRCLKPPGFSPLHIPKRMSVMSNLPGTSLYNDRAMALERAKGQHLRHIGLHTSATGDGPDSPEFWGGFAENIRVKRRAHPAPNTSSSSSSAGLGSYPTPPPNPSGIPPNAPHPASPPGDPGVVARVLYDIHSPASVFFKSPNVALGVHPVPQGVRERARAAGERRRRESGVGVVGVSSGAPPSSAAPHPPRAAATLEEDEGIRCARQCRRLEDRFIDSTLGPLVVGYRGVLLPIFLLILLAAVAHPALSSSWGDGESIAFGLFRAEARLSELLIPPSGNQMEGFASESPKFAAACSGEGGAGRIPSGGFAAAACGVHRPQPPPFTADACPFLPMEVALTFSTNTASTHDSLTPALYDCINHYNTRAGPPGVTPHQGYSTCAVLQEAVRLAEVHKGDVISGNASGGAWVPELKAYAEALGRAGDVVEGGGGVLWIRLVYLMGGGGVDAHGVGFIEEQRGVWAGRANVWRGVLRAEAWSVYFDLTEYCTQLDGVVTAVCAVGFAGLPLCVFAMFLSARMLCVSVCVAVFSLAVLSSGCRLLDVRLGVEEVFALCAMLVQLWLSTLTTLTHYEDYLMDKYSDLLARQTTRGQALLVALRRTYKATALPVVLLLMMMPLVLTASLTVHRRVALFITLTCCVWLLAANLLLPALLAQIGPVALSPVPRVVSAGVKALAVTVAVVLVVASLVLG